jgi:hypothetical protein
VADEEIKSTLEIAMEKAAKLRQQTPEEIREQRKRALEPRGRAIALRYFEGSLEPKDLKAELAGLDDDDRDIVRKVLKSYLCDGIRLGQTEQSQRAIRALRELEHGTALEGRARELETLYVEHVRESEQLLASFEESGRERLRQLGISGSAIRSNPVLDEELRQRLSELEQAFAGRLEQLRQELL